MLDDISPDGLWHSQTLAGWLLGTAFVLLVVGFVIGALRMSGSKAFGSSEGASKGMAAMILTLAGAVVLGSVGGAIMWSSSDSRTTGVLPEVAGQRDMVVERQAASTNCQSTVAVAVSNHRGSLGQQEPDDDDHQTMESIAQQLGAFDRTATDASTRTGAWLPHDSSAEADEWPSMIEDRDQKFSRIQWLPDGSGNDCSSSNRSAASGADIEIVMWESSGMGSIYVIYTIPVD